MSVNRLTAALLFALAGAASAADPADAVKKLGAPEFAVREAAQRELTDAGEAALPAVLGAFGEAGEIGERAAAVVRAWAAGGDAELAARCEEELYARSDYGLGQEAVRAEAALFATRPHRLSKAVEALEALGAVVQWGRAPARFDRTSPPSDEQRIRSVDFHPRRYVGGDEGLKHLRAFTHLPNVRLLVATRSISDRAAMEAAAHMDGPRLEIRGGSIGISGGHFSPCTVGNVLPGQAAEKAGLREGDEIHRLNEHVIRNFGDLIDRLVDFEEGDEVTLTVRRMPWMNRGQKEDERFEDGVADIALTLGGWEHMPVDPLPAPRRIIAPRLQLGPNGPATLPFQPGPLGPNGRIKGILIGPNGKLQIVPNDPPPQPDEPAGDDQKAAEKDAVPRLRGGGTPLPGGGPE